jgi:hypothetical protein
VWSAEKRAEGLEYMHPKPSSHSGRIVGNPEVIQKLACRKLGKGRVLHTAGVNHEKSLVLVHDSAAARTNTEAETRI